MEQVPGSSRNLYKKIRPGGKLDDKPLEQGDFDLTVQYMSKCFPKAFKVQSVVEDTLKRVGCIKDKHAQFEFCWFLDRCSFEIFLQTFVLEKTEPKRTFLTKKKPRPVKTGSNRKTRVRKERTVPPVLRYDRFQELNDMWKSYISELLL